jgi:hypothetical protein
MSWNQRLAYRLMKRRGRHSMARTLSWAVQKLLQLEVMDLRLILPVVV